jgi:hypothetical protein
MTYHAHLSVEERCPEPALQALRNAMAVMFTRRRRCIWPTSQDEVRLGLGRRAGRSSPHIQRDGGSVVEAAAGSSDRKDVTGRCCAEVATTATIQHADPSKGTGE